MGIILIILVCIVVAFLLIIGIFVLSIFGVHYGIKHHEETPYSDTNSSKE